MLKVSSTTAATLYRLNYYDERCRTQGCVQVVILVRNDPQPTPRAARGDSQHGVDVVMDDAGNRELSHFSPSATLISRMLSMPHGIMPLVAH
jgi:hypothetical protein